MPIYSVRPRILVLALLVISFGASEGKTARAKDSSPVVISRERPQYPFELRIEGISGEEVVEFIVDRAGNARNAFSVRSTHPGFERPAVVAVSKWKFRPGVKNGRAVNTRMRVPIKFAVDEVEPQAMLPPLRTPVRVNPSESSRPVYPFYALLENSQDTVECAALFGSNGEVSNVAWRGKMDEEFKASIEAWLDATKFIPATEAGKTVARIHDFKWRFNPYMGDVRITDEAAAILKRLRLGGDAAKFIKAKELDQKISPIEQGSPVFPLSIDPEINKGDAIIEFFVDETGHVQLPRIVTSSDPAFGYAACQAIAGWRFTPPRRGGKPEVVKLRVPVDFKRE